MEERAAVIDWSYTGEPDFLVGTGATRAERALAAAAGLAIALDVGGGVVVNSLNSCKRFYHTPALFLEIVYGHGVREEPYRPRPDVGHACSVTDRTQIKADERRFFSIV